MKNEWLAYNIAMPTALIKTYDYLQHELNYFLSNENSRNFLKNKADLTLHKGNFWRQLRDAYCNRIATWPVKNKAWYSYIVFENLRRELQSKQEAMIIWNCIVSSQGSVDTTLLECHAKHVYPSKTRVRNLIRANKQPDLPYSATFQLDYTVSASQIFKMDDNNFCSIRTMDGTWIDYQIILPSSLNHQLTGTIAKPRFMKRHFDGKYMGICSYAYTPEIADGDKILGVDIGKIKLFSATAVGKNGEYSKEYIQSRRTSNKRGKLNILLKEKANMYNRIRRIASYKRFNAKQKVRQREYIRITKKIARLKIDLSKNVAYEVIAVAVKEKCSEIHIENLAWLESKGGKWNHSEMQNYIQEKAKTKGIKVVKVNARNTSKTNPVNDEIGTISNRTVSFKDGTKIDRDLLASINIALRSKNKKTRKLPKLKSKHASATHVKAKSRRKEIKELINKIKGNAQIVAFCPCLPSRTTDGAWCPAYMDIPNSSLLVKNGTPVSTHY